jgi:hypothetical protein
MKRFSGIHFLIATVVLASAPAAAAEPLEDPFAAERVMSESALADARGGLRFRGFLFEFGIRTSLLINASLPDGTAGAPVTATFDESIQSLIINNTLDDVTISQTIAIDVHALNYGAMIATSAGAAVARDLPSALYPIGLSGF